MIMKMRDPIDITKLKETVFVSAEHAKMIRRLQPFSKISHVIRLHKYVSLPALLSVSNIEVVDNLL